MTIILLACVVLLLCIAVDLIKINWLRRVGHILLLFGGLIAAFNSGSEAGNVIARADVSREVQDVITIMQESSRTNTVEELRAKIEIMKVELPKMVISDDRLPLMKALKIVE